ncbi:Similar to Enhancer of mRNA-decapping protein 3; acc. no. O94752 [Pyronema omphalodes CBS 100304]|uniref:Enhancer of mRNA-decapping protein 3 n=1 Tax=Pyronema omphalodes (strain CBS 100304) TaxID=1076935 RepID=U4LH13_PYROM|nr:Similar to Enhancer of mRNA-decapping protein 3; acc. no. O94752 [Pyronema omphalodes CBS 100304]
MAQQFVGSKVFLTLNDRTQLRGLVADVVDQELYLTNVHFPATGYSLPNYRVHGSNVFDLELEDDEKAPPPPAPPAPHPGYPMHPNIQTQPNYYQNQLPPPIYSQTPSSSGYATPQSYVSNIPPPAQVQMPSAPQASAAFDDPAIVSISSKPSVAPAMASRVSPQLAPPPPPPNFALQKPITTPTRASAQPVPSAMARTASMARTGSAVQHTIQQTAQAALSSVASPSNGSRSSVPETPAQQFGNLTIRDADDETDFAPTPVRPDRFAGKRAKRGKKMADTDESVVLKPGMFGGAIAQAAVGGYGPARKQRKPARRNRYEANDEEGWATEDVTDFKETEFDFQGNLDRFDKKTVFSQIKAEDTTADEARLVSFNRLPRNKVPPRKNYGNRENVLGGYNNAQVDREDWPEAIESDSSDAPSEPVRSRSRLQARRLTSTDNLASGSGGTATKPSFRLSNSNRPCPIVSPLQMLDVERIAEVELGLTDDMMTENGGRGIATVALQAFGKRISATNHNALPVVLVFAGNNKSGARAICAGRHLKNHHVRVMLCVLGSGHDEEQSSLLVEVRRQLNIFRNAGGRVTRWEELQTNIKTLDSPPELIIDGLLGVHRGFDELAPQDQAVVFQMINFANKSKASVLSVDIPSGVDGSSGELTIEDSSYMRAKWVVSMAAPKTGLLSAVTKGIGSSWNLFVADTGISGMAWRKYGTRRRHGVEFCADWVVQLVYYPGSA